MSWKRNAICYPPPPLPFHVCTSTWVLVYTTLELGWDPLIPPTPTLSPPFGVRLSCIEMAVIKGYHYHHPPLFVKKSPFFATMVRVHHVILRGCCVERCKRDACQESVRYGRVDGKKEKDVISHFKYIFFMLHLMLLSSKFRYIFLR